MNLIHFLKHLDNGEPLGDSLLSRVTGTLKINARQIVPGDVYLTSFDTPEKSVAYKLEAKQRGAILVLETRDARQIWTRWAKNCYPEQPKRCVAVTGTNGKTSVAHFTQQLWRQANSKAASIGTLGVMVNGKISASQPAELVLTTPDAMNLHKCLHELARDDVQHVALEASSHGLDQHRLDQVNLTAAAFTNLTHEHLDYHATMAAYFHSKSRLFTDILPVSGTAVLNREDFYGKQIGKICQERGIRILWFGREEADLCVENFQSHSKGLSLTLNILGKKIALDLPFIGLFQVENILAALGLAIASGLNIDQALQGLSKLQGVPGRMEYAGETAKGGAVYVDYAHKPFALENILKSARAHTSGKLVVVFGCGGNRDTAKRAMMGEIAQAFSDEIYVTDDNPRHEDPASIRAKILKECPKAIEIASRDQAIKAALSNIKAGDICIIAGKGHESGQIIKDKVLPFNDLNVVQQYLNE